MLLPVQNAPAVDAAASDAPPIGPSSTPPELVAWAFEKFADRNIVITTQFGMEGCALIDMTAEAAAAARVVYLDTMFFFKETYELRDRLAQRYPNVEFVNGGTDMTPEKQAELHGDELWKRNPDLCCQIRKVDPMRDVMRDIDVWLTGLRRSQSSTRANLQPVEWDWKFQVLKVNPLASWSREQVWQYIQERNVPYNPLHEQGYPTLGCTHCTKAVPGATVTDYTRAGRWDGVNKTECGLHGAGI